MPTKREVRQSLEFWGVMTGNLDAADCQSLGKKPAPRKQTEAREQTALISWARLSENKYPALRLLFAIPNGGTRAGGAIEGAHLKAQGVRAGVPDLFLAYPSGEYAGLFVEMKAHGGKVQDTQREWLDALTVAGYKAAICYGFDEARETIEQYLRG